jgi:hypothetical protein
MPNSVEIKTQIPHVLFRRLKMIAELEESLVEEAVEDVLANTGSGLTPWRCTGKWWPSTHWSLST